MRPDIERLRNALDELEDQIDYLELEMVDDPNWAEPSDTSYLNDDDRANPDIMANVEAMAATNKLVAWFAQDQEGYVGLWRGPSSTPLEVAPILRLDSEGQYEIVALTIGDYILTSVDEDDFDEAREALVAAGFAVGASQAEIWRSIEDCGEEPNDYRHKLYNEGRKQRGLEPIEA